MFLRGAERFSTLEEWLHYSLIRLTARFDIAVLNPEGVERLTDIMI
jgi:hypothetical protein